MSARPHTWIIDQLDESAASIEVDGDAVITVPRWLLPAAAREGDVLAVAHDRAPKGRRSVLTIEIDEAAKKTALADSAAQVEKARARSKKADPGGDITL